jgi:hypothetical protein
MIEQVKKYFRDNYPYVYLEDVSDKTILEYLENGWVLNVPFERKMDLLYDYILSQDLCGVDE